MSNIRRKVLCILIMSGSSILLLIPTPFASDENIKDLFQNDNQLSIPKFEMKNLFYLVSNTWKNITENDGVRYMNYKLPGCPCMRRMPISKQNPRENSTCSSYATARGPGQNVYTYSYYRPRILSESKEYHISKFLKQMEEVLIFVGDKYPPGWNVRLYHNISTTDTQETKYICHLFCKFANFDPCDVTDLPAPICNLYKKQPIGRLWRFATLGDPTVDVFVSRDSDNIVTDREVYAVKEWLASNKSIHRIRDHPGHFFETLAGLWGARNKKGFDKLRDQIFSSPPDHNKMYDQILLSKFLKTLDQNEILEHASYHCNEHGPSVPFPTERKGATWVGYGHFKDKHIIDLVSNTSCPLDCRPIEHKDWIHC